MNAITYHIINSPAALDFSLVFEMYEKAFPKNEQQSRKTLESRLITGQEILLIGKSNEEILVFAFMFDMVESDFLLLDYFAVSETKRGEGIGSAFFGYLGKWAKSRNKILLMEVDDPEYGSEIEIKRVKFYQKNGAKTIEGIPYILPPLDGFLPTNQILMTVNLKSELKVNEKKHLVESLYTQLYDRTTGDPFLTKIIENIS